MNKKTIIGIVVVLALFIALIYFLVSINKSKEAAEREIASIIANLNYFVQVRYGKVNVSILKHELKISELSIAPLGYDGKFIKINEVIIKDFDNKSTIPLYMTVSCRGVYADLAKIIGPEAKKLNELGYSEKLVFNADIDYAFSTLRCELIISKLLISAPNIGEINFSALLGNLNSTTLYAGIITTYPQLFFHGAQINYRDDSFLQRFLVYSSNKNKQSVEYIKSQLIDQLEYSVQDEEGPYTSAAMNEIKEFINNPIAITIIARPTEPMALGKLMRLKNNEEVAKTLNLRVYSKR